MYANILSANIASLSLITQMCILSGFIWVNQVGFVLVSSDTIWFMFWKQRDERKTLSEKEKKIRAK